MLSEKDQERPEAESPPPIRRFAVLRRMGRVGWRRIVGLEPLPNARAGRHANGDDPADLSREEFDNPIVEVSQPRDRPPKVVLTEKEATDLARRHQRSEREVFFHFLHHMRPYWGKGVL